MLKRNSYINDPNKRDPIRKSGSIYSDSRRRQQFAFYHNSKQYAINSTQQQQQIVNDVNIIELKLNNKKLKGLVNFWISIKQLKNLKILNLENNKIINPHLNYLSQTIQVINLNKNQIQEICFNKVIPNLNSIQIMDNNLLKISFSCNNPNLRYINISKNKISIINTIQLNNLQQIIATNNQLVVVNLNLNIRKVNFSHNLLKSLIFINKLKYLTFLDVSHNEISDIKYNSFCQKFELEELHINNNKLKYLQGIRFCKKLNILKMNQNQIFSLKKLIAEIQNLDCLQNLNFDQNQFSNEEIQNFDEFENYIWSKMPKMRLLNNKQKSQKPPLKNLKQSDRLRQKENLNNKKNQLQEKKHDTQPHQQNSLKNQKNRTSSNYYKQSPYKIYTEQLQDTQYLKDNSKYLNFTLGEKQSSCDLTLKNDSLFMYKNENNQRFSQILPFLFKFKQIYKDLEQLSDIPVRAILKTQKNKNIMKKYESGIEFTKINELFRSSKKYISCLIKCTNLQKILEINRMNHSIKLNNTNQQMFTLAFLNSRFQTKGFHDFIQQKISFTDLLNDLKNIQISLKPNFLCNFNIILRIQLNGVSRQEITCMTPVYIFETHEILEITI